MGDPTEPAEGVTCCLPVCQAQGCAGKHLLGAVFVSWQADHEVGFTTCCSALAGQVLIP